MTCRLPNCNCQAEAKYLPVMLLFAAPRLFPNAPPARSVAGIPVCEEHRSGISLEFLLSDIGFAYVCQAFTALGRQPPERSATKLEFISIDSPEARSFFASSTADWN